MIFLQLLKLCLDLGIMVLLMFYIWLTFHRAVGNGTKCKDVFPSDIAKYIVIVLVLRLIYDLYMTAFTTFHWWLVFAVALDVWSIYIWWDLYKVNYAKEYEMYEKFQKEEAMKALSATKAEDDDEAVI